MALITLSKPYKNSARNVTRTTRTLLVNAFQEAANITKTVDWSSLFEKRNFFKEYNQFLRMTVSALTRQEYWNWYNHFSSGSLVHKINFKTLFFSKIKEFFLAFFFQSQKQNETLSFNSFKRFDSKYIVSQSYYNEISECC
jgi:poly(A) polymerase Pap1